ncbi:MAG TPA: CcmD family protein [Longimicrobium sp.]|jgi:CcmD family protein|nr:CcmD family protein [Longimicrobium sp.]
MRPTRFSRLAAVIAASLALAATPPTRASAQDSPPPAAAVAQPASSALPGEQAPAPPRTLRAYWHVFIAYALAWLFLFGYALSLGRRFRNLERDVDALRGAS